MTTNGVAVRRVTGRALACALIAACAGFGGAGCNPFDREEAQPLTADAFASRRVEGRVDPEPIDRPGQVIVDGVRAPAEDDRSAGRQADPGSPRGVNEISPPVRQAVRTPGDNGRGTTARARRPATRPATARRVNAATAPANQPGASASAEPSDPSGQYVIFGTVLATVSGRPIYAHKVLTLLDNALRAEAQQYDARQFRVTAADLIRKEIDKQIREELIFALAEKALDAREKQVAEMLTAQWQNDERTKAGGSLELAKRRWADEGWDFGERMDHQYRASMAQVYLQRRVLPLVNVTAADVRRYYEANKDTAEFSTPARAKFRVIKIDPKALRLPGGAAEARRIASEIRAKATDANFESLARGEFNDPTLRASGGLVVVPGSEEGYLPKETYVAEKLEDAVWALQPGQVTDVIEERGAFYIAKLEDRKEAVARPFEDLAVQDYIKDKLRGQQLMELQRQRQNELMRDAIVQEHPQMMQVAMDMAMQRYPEWAKK